MEIQQAVNLLASLQFYSYIAILAFTNDQNSLH